MNLQPLLEGGVFCADLFTRSDLPVTFVVASSLRLLNVLLDAIHDLLSPLLLKLCEMSISFQLIIIF